MLNAGIRKIVHKLSVLGILLACLVIASSEGTNKAKAATCCSACQPNYYSCLGYCHICGCDQQACFLSCNNYLNNCGRTCDGSC
jgi:hypothetical protein